MTRPQEPSAPPPTSPTEPPELASASPTAIEYDSGRGTKPRSGLDSYNAVAETVGMVPTLRASDNLLSLAAGAYHVQLSISVSRGTPCRWYRFPNVQ